MFYENFQSACKSSGTTPTAVVNKLGISKGSVTYWKNKIPNGSVIVQISELLNVSCDFLLTGKDAADAKLTPKEQELINCYRYMDENRKKRLLDTASDLACASREYKKDSPVPYMENKIG